VRRTFETAIDRPPGFPAVIGPERPRGLKFLFPLPFPPPFFLQDRGGMTGCRHMPQAPGLPGGAEAVCEDRTLFSNLLLPSFFWRKQNAPHPPRRHKLYSRIFSDGSRWPHPRFESHCIFFPFLFFFSPLFFSFLPRSRTRHLLSNGLPCLTAVIGPRLSYLFPPLPPPPGRSTADAFFFNN